MATYSMEGTHKGCYPDTTVLINKLDIRNQKMLNVAELRIVILMTMYPKRQDLSENSRKVFFHIIFLVRTQTWDATKLILNVCPNVKFFVLRIIFFNCSIIFVRRIIDISHIIGYMIFCLFDCVY